MPINRFRSAEPNDGALAAAALLREQAVRYVLTLNFDLSMSHALAYLGAADDVVIVNGPHNHGTLGVSNLIYLHRNVDAPAEDWVLTAEELENGWRNGWGQVMAAMALAGPVSIFVGLGSRASVLVETTQRIRTALPAGVQSFQVDPRARAQSAYADALDIGPDHYIQLRSCEFMDRLGARVAAAHGAAVRDACELLAKREGLSMEGVDAVCSRLAEMGLVRLGQLRARWMLVSARYLPGRTTDAALVADLVLALAAIEIATTASTLLADDGIVELRQGNKVVTTFILASGRGVLRWGAMDQEFGGLRRRHSRLQEPAFAVVSGVPGARTELSPPEDVTTPRRKVISSSPTRGSHWSAWTSSATILLDSPRFLSYDIRRW